MYGVWFWSKDGIYPQLTVQRSGTILFVSFDGNLISKAQLPENFKFDSVHVANWWGELNSPYFVHESNLNKTEYELSKSANFTEHVTLHNPFSFRLVFRGDSVFSLYGNPYRHLNVGWEDADGILKNTTTERLQITLYNGLKWIAWLVLKAFPFISIVYLMFLALIIFEASRPVKTVREKIVLTKSIIIGALLLGALSFGISRYLMITYTDEVPHVPDAVSYIILSKMIASGKLTVPYSEIPQYLRTEHFNGFFQHWYDQHNSYFTKDYLLGHPLLLSLGNIFGIFELIPPLVGAACVILVTIHVFVITSSLFFASLSGVMFLISPFFQTQTIDFMSHNTAAFYLLLSFLPYTFKKKYLYLILGFSLGLLAQTRPLTFVPVLLIYFIYEIFELIQTRCLKDALKKLLYVMLGAILPFVVFIIYNKLSTGSVFATPYSNYSFVTPKIGFGSEYKLGYGMLQGFSNLVAFSLFFLKNYFLSFGLFFISVICLPFAQKYIKRIMIVIQLMIIGVIGVWFFYDGSWFMYGPRFIYESVPLFCMLYGAMLFTLFRTFARHTFFKVIACGEIFFLVFQLMLFEFQWFGLKTPEYRDMIFVPSTVKELKGFNFSDGRFKHLAEKDQKTKVFLMKDCGNWWCFSGAWLNTYPLEKSKHIFVDEPNVPFTMPPNSIIIDWNSL
ncbi:hypothetical protein COY90_01420 [Candidatus Roizmanbacteria bacterium CG_4_10_14_0_8_um_filter_39_9]|uniref:Glycosyltransferase RgtA/B/C/D-like domain-containing protein n=1 Tax=Candidatus Roizmanbacteria bacterium CG_4_10_14_0_8_um_filter_39_9 TaxID=1974829 RepID=A0A2M7QEI3_9BACT|nr:MAG: hypothetical protein COY90_01420 [Candidatus Roizmanbacteria bacterium CG_4_10_14_0_8_um_filter_39_9]